MIKQRVFWERIRLAINGPFFSVYGGNSVFHTYWIRLAEDSGWGEGASLPQFGINERDMIACWEKAARSDAHFPVSIHQVHDWIGEDGPAPARCALELALLDRIGRAEGKPLYQILDIPEPRNLTSSISIQMTTPQKMADVAMNAKNYSIFKVKLSGQEGDEDCIAAIREVRPDAKIRIDVNAGWDLPTGMKMIKRLAIYQPELIEQPLPKTQFTEMGILQSSTPIPIVADESVNSLEEVHSLGLAGVAGINLKLMKVGGVLPSIDLIKVAQDYNMRIMLGCSFETSLAVTAMAHLSGLAEWVDLDSPLLIQDDPFLGIQYAKDLKISLSDLPGIGVQRKESA